MNVTITTKTFDGQGGRDEFQRKSIAQKAIKLLKSDIDISPMVIDGSWGTGKTEFCHKLINLMKQDNTHNIIYIDAFKADHVDEPLMTVLAEIIKILPDGPRRKAFINRVLPAVRYTLKTVAKAGVSHLLRQDFADLTNDFDEVIQKAADDSIDKTAELILKDHVEAEKSLQTLQTALTAIASQNPIIIFIDELDRCRPNFAVDMLEIIKHTFDVEGVSFVLVTNTQQLRASINHCYGQAVNAQRYLDKFIKFQFELSPHSQRHMTDPVLAANAYFYQLIGEKGCLSSSLLSNTLLRKFLIEVIRHQGLSLREIETLALHIEVVQVLSNSHRFITDEYIGYSLLRLVGVMLVCFRPDILREIRKGVVDADLLGDFLGVTKLPYLEEEGREIPEVCEFIMASLSSDFNENNINYATSEDQQKKWNSYMRHVSFMEEIPYRGRAVAQFIETANIMAFE